MGTCVCLILQPISGWPWVMRLQLQGRLRMPAKLAFMVQSLDQIRRPIQFELQSFERYFRDSMRSRVPLLDRITYYIVRRKGKQVRPMFVFLCARLFGPVNESSYRAAALIELLHTASLVHDDVVDDAHRRRGFFSVNALWKNKIAVLVGDFLLARGMLLALENEEYPLLQIMSRAVKDMSEGELLQMEKARRLDISEEVYFEIIRQKTASLIAAACAAGASSAGATLEEVAQMRLFGEKIGLAFQIRDDLFDLGDDDVGKPRGIDIKEKKMTLPLIYALRRADKSERRRIIRLVKHYHDEQSAIDEVVRFVRASGGMEYARWAMVRCREEAFEMLRRCFPDTEVRQALESLVLFVTERKR